MRLSTFACILLGVAIVSPLLAATPAPPVRPYLALGDSVSFGFITQAGFEYVNPDNFIGFPNYVGLASIFVTTNAACPGETTGSFLSSAAPDDGCRTFRSLVPLHVAYSSTQTDFATSFLKAHPNTKLVTVGLGANDVFLLEKACLNDPACIASGLPAVLANVTDNLTTILTDLRGTGFRGPIIVVNYYSTDYADANETGIIELLNEALANAAATEGVPVADVFTAFQTVASAAGGHTCNAGLLNASPQNEFVCDVHPSQSGQRLIAAAVERTFTSTRQ